MNPVTSKLVWWLQKKKWLTDALLFGQGPDFVVERKPPTNLGHIPVFTFHVAVPERFEAQCAYLAENNYRTMDATELQQVMSGHLRPQSKSVAITFDDGLKQVWTVAYPILRKYGLEAIVFLIPGCIPDETREPRNTLNDVWKGDATEEEVFGIWPDESPLATWSEITEMHQSGHVDFQSHSMWHSLVFKSSQIVDFGRPDYDKYYFGNIHVPLYRSNETECTDRKLHPGMPIYAAGPRFQVKARFFDDEELREHCIRFVAKEGGHDFFHNKNWRSVLLDLTRRYRESNDVREQYETPEQRDNDVKRELRIAKEAIEYRLNGKSVEHFCFPWYEGAPFARSCAWETGHKLVYSDYTANSPGNVPGSDERRIARVDECFLRRLPGSGRMSKSDIVREFFRLRDLPRRMFPGGARDS